MLIMSPYFLPFCPERRQVNRLLGRRGFLIDDWPERDEDRRLFHLCEWAMESPEIEVYEGVNYSIIRVYSQYLVRNPVTEYNRKSGKTKQYCSSEKRSRIHTIWLPLGVDNPFPFLICVGGLKGEGIFDLLLRIDSRFSKLNVIKMRFDFEKLRQRHPEGWMHGCDKRPGIIHKGTLFGDFDFSRPSELDSFMNRANGTVSKQDGIFIPFGSQRLKVRVLDHGRFQVPGFAVDDFFSEDRRGEIMAKCFAIVKELSRCVEKAS